MSYFPFMPDLHALMVPISVRPMCSAGLFDYGWDVVIVAWWIFVSFVVQHICDGLNIHRATTFPPLPTP